jgi:uncharacterized protein (TIGR00251 family)
MKTSFDMSENSILLRLTVRPGGSTDEIIGLYGDPARLKIKVRAKPVKGDANKSVITFLSRVFNLPKSSFDIVRGSVSANKDIQIEISGHDHSEIVRIINDLSK